MRYQTPLLATAAIILSTAPTFADVGDQLFKLLPDDGTTGDWFGSSVAISDAIAIVGSRGDSNNNGTGAGSAYLFDTTTGKQIFKLLPNDGSTNEKFGRAVAISGTTVIIGAWQDDDNGFASGSAYLFDISNPLNPIQIAKLLAKDGAAEDIFGHSVAISGTTAIVGADGDDDNGDLSGSAYIFDAATGLQILKLLPNDGTANDRFGRSVAVNGTIAIVGASGTNDNPGSAYLFDTTTGQQLFELLPDDKAHYGYGISVAISSTTAIVGAFGSASGSAYLFDSATGIQIAKLLANDGEASDHFGRSVAINGNTVIVGAWWDDDNGYASGSAYLFDISDPAKPTQIAKLLANDGATGDNFGESVAIGGPVGEETAITGAVRDNDNGALSGSAYLFVAANITHCPWDLDNSGSVGISDLLELFAQWGTPGTADFDDDGVVGTSDLLILLANWGPCK